jgi:hypothetical protein
MYTNKECHPRIFTNARESERQPLTLHPDKFMDARSMGHDEEALQA